MKPHKIKLETTGKDLSTGYEGYAFTIQAIYYSSNDPSKFLRIYDNDGDEVIYPIPGALDPKTVPVGNITVALPLVIVDDTPSNDVILRGYLERSSLTGKT